MQHEPNELVKYAVLEIARCINQDKMAPQEALVKVSKEMDLNPNFIKRASEGINVALHYNHFKKNANAKETDFPITDADKATSLVFGEKEKTACEYVSDTFPKNEYEDKQVNFSKVLTNPAYKDAYLKILNSDEKNTSFDLSKQGICEKSANYISRLEKELDHLLTEKSGAALKVNTLFSKMVSEFSKDASMRASFDEFESQVYSKHGEVSVPFIDYVYKTANITEERGAHDAGYKMFADSHVTSLFDSFMKASAELISLTEATKEAEENLAFEKSYIKEAYVKLGEAEQEKLASTDDLKKNEILDTDDPVLKLAMEKIAEGGKDELSKFGPLGPVINVLRGSGGSKGIQETPEEQLNRKFMLQDLMVTDPIISKMHPQQIASGYEQMLRIAPELSKEKEVVRSTLRLLGSSQALTAYDAQQLTSANTDLTKQRMLQRGDLQPKI